MRWCGAGRASSSYALSPPSAACFYAPVARGKDGGVGTQQPSRSGPDAAVRWVGPTPAACLCLCGAGVGSVREGGSATRQGRHLAGGRKPQHGFRRATDDDRERRRRLACMPALLAVRSRRLGRAKGRAATPHEHTYLTTGCTGGCFRKWLFDPCMPPSSRGHQWRACRKASRRRPAPRPPAAAEEKVVLEFWGLGSTGYRVRFHPISAQGTAQSAALSFRNRAVGSFAWAGAAFGRQSWRGWVAGGSEEEVERKCAGGPGGND